MLNVLKRNMAKTTWLSSRKSKKKLVHKGVANDKIDLVVTTIG